MTKFCASSSRMNGRRERERDYTIYKRIDIELDNDRLIQLIMYGKWCVRGPTMQPHCFDFDSDRRNRRHAVAVTVSIANAVWIGGLGTLCCTRQHTAGDAWKSRQYKASQERIARCVDPASSMNSRWFQRQRISPIQRLINCQEMLCIWRLGSVVCLNETWLRIYL